MSLNSQLFNPVAPRLTSAPMIYNAQYHEYVNNQLRLYFSQLDAALQQVLLGFNHYGTFYDTTTQTNPVINTARPITFTTTAEAHGIYIEPAIPSRIYVVRDGVYNFQFSAQLDHGSGGAVNFYIWFRKNGVDIPASASKIVLVGPNDEKVAAWNYLVTMKAGDYFELVWSADDTGAVLRYEAAVAPVPAIPSAILTVTYVYPNSTPRSV